MKTKTTAHFVQCFALLALLATLNPQLSPCFAQGTNAFTYQGRLNESGQPATGLYDFRAQIYNRAATGDPGDALVSSTLTLSGVPVTNGLFVLTLDFGAAPFPGDARWLSLEVRTNAALNYANLTPRQPITPTPYAITSGNLSGTVPAGQLSGNLSATALPTGGNWPLTSTLTLDTSTLAIDPINHRVGIGTSTPSVALTVRSSGSFYGIEHTDGTRRLSTYLDANACWFGTVSSHPLYFFVNNGLSSMTLDLAGRVGIGTTSPAWPLHLVTAQSVVRLDSTANSFGSVLELRNNTASPGTLGAINFNNAAATYPGQIAYSGGDALTFRTAGAQRMQLDNAGRLDVTGANSVASLNAVDTVLSVPLPRAVKATSDGPLSTAILGSSASGTALGGYSASGIAGYFNNLTVIESDSSLAKPQLRLHETQDGDFARLEFQVASRPNWHIAVGGGAANQMNFYNSTNGDVMSLAQDGTLFVKVLTITGGADIAEPFQMSQAGLPKGAVVVIDEENPGRLKLSTEAYDKRVAGIISGAGGVNPGLSLNQHGVLEGDQHVALTGRVYVQADTTQGAIKPGDLLTTSATPGHAMKANDSSRIQGAILGKAMTELKEGQGLVLVLVTLQ